MYFIIILLIKYINTLKKYYLYFLKVLITFKRCASKVGVKFRFLKPMDSAKMNSRFSSKYLVISAHRILSKIFAIGDNILIPR